MGISVDRIVSLTFVLGFDAGRRRRVLVALIPRSTLMASCRDRPVASWRAWGAVLRLQIAEVVWAASPTYRDAIAFVLPIVISWCVRLGPQVRGREGGVEADRLAGGGRGHSDRR
jgi:hypothetical protein